MSATDLMIELSDLWYDERCEVKVDFDESAGSTWPWTISLTWVSEHDNPHQAEWAQYAWLFYGTTLDEALTEALEWAKRLVPFERCGACDGRGSYGILDKPVICPECGGSGLAHNAVQSDVQS
jgi:hypothetical protein